MQHSCWSERSAERVTRLCDCKRGFLLVGGRESFFHLRVSRERKGSFAHRANAPGKRARRALGWTPANAPNKRARRALGWTPANAPAWSRTPVRFSRLGQLGQVHYATPYIHLFSYRALSVQELPSCPKLLESLQYQGSCVGQVPAP